MLELICIGCHEVCWTDADDVILARRSPEDDGTIAYACFKCGTVQSLVLECQDVIFVMLAGATLVDECFGFGAE